MQLWLRFPTELESDLSEFHDRSIGEWLDGRMSSRLLLVLARHMNQHGAFRKAARRGNYTTDELVSATIANELMAIRYNKVGGEEPVFFTSEAQQRDEVNELEIDEDEAAEACADLGLGNLF